MTHSHPPKDAQSVDPQQLSSLLKAAADPLRLEILRLLAQDSYGVLELAGLLDMPQSGMSHHLKVLSKGGWLTTRREGNSIYYRRKPLLPGHPLNDAKAALLATIDQQPLSDERRARLSALYEARSQTSQQFFAENAEKFQAQQDLIASFPVYGDSVREALAAISWPDNATAIEVGPGAGELLPWLSEHFRSVTAIDNAPEMLAQARANNQGLTNVNFLLGDTRTALGEQLTAHCVVINMVLHHTPSPADVFQDLAGLLTPGGWLVITDLCRHEQSWAQANCGDLWQGFEPEDFSHWAKRAGLEEGQSAYFALRNGFQIQIRQFQLAP
ncbi:metalloregulator ArsR/SmtB family transcription factor [Simiduia sp. 21SJ11W-1]|uniref:ArsR/SmtB family transcription factor n=1 Tax=Simiduia sp. 21SJ11W-1 TaxID=2909669 RepID=UPI00209F1BF2|nr:metalloregulator ArsR/SmtB family transcription factor [Simiduia sp. 21SJ11W-1]UTA48241.1 metalloregulator ArsR/SmtB family transcription factor [Simiduia sp. 21SJ11W-1]